jgi:signal transduction histidine kinase
MDKVVPDHFNLKLGHKALILVVVPVLFEFIFVGVLFGLLRQAEYEVWKETHAKTVISEANDVTNLLYDSGMALVGFNRTHDRVFYTRYKLAQAELNSHLQSLDLITLGHSGERQLFDSAKRQAQLAQLSLAKAESILRQNAEPSTNAQFSILQTELESEIPTLVKSLKGMVEYEDRIAEASPAAEEKSRSFVLVCLLAGMIGSTFVAIGLARYFNHGTTERLAVLVENTNRLAQKKQLKEEISGSDEIAQLDVVFHQMAKDLFEAAKKKQELVAMVSHDLRTPLMSVQALLTVINNGGYGLVPEQVKTKLHQAEDNTTRLIDLINDLLDVEMLGAGPLALILQEFTIDSVFDRSFSALASLAEKEGIFMVIDNSDLTVHADADRLTQVLINLLSNAIKFSPTGSTVYVWAEADGNQVKVIVEDEGRGVPVNMREKIFERFQQSEAADGKRGQGTGLGLAICKAIIQSHQGTIGVDSGLEKGSKFWFRMPVDQSVIESPLSADR